MTQQKMYLLVGPKRSGKGTIARVLTGLLGVHNTAAPTLASLTQNFGLQPLVGKPLAVISDARLGTRADSMVAVERLLSISGEDTLTIDRKYRDPWTGRLPTRFVILTNELPCFTDSSGALASRFVMSILRTSFYGRENPKLTAELLEESPGVFNWALEGLDRLRDRGYFVMPASAREAQRRLEDLASPIGAFVRDLCEVGQAFEVEKDVLWDAWKSWCVDEGRDRPGTKAVFARDLNATVPGLTSVRPRDGDERFPRLARRDVATTIRRTPDHP
jgi:putative DNA primase/helicase